MWRVNATDMFGIFAGIILGLAFFGLIAYLVYLFVYRRIQMNHEMRLEMIRQGLPVRPESDRMGSLKAGIISAAIGLGFLVGLLFIDTRHDDVGGVIILGLVPLFVGVGLVLFYYLARHNGEPAEKHNYLPGSSES